MRLNVNIDHIATIRQARKTFEPDVVAAAVLADLAGASGITVHLRGDRRHIQDADVRGLRAVVKTHLNLEMAVTDEMVAIAQDIKPTVVTLVPERPDEITTEGGLDVIALETEIGQAVERLKAANIIVSLFIDPVLTQVEAAHHTGAQQIEICTARYADLTDPTTRHDKPAISEELTRIRQAARLGGNFAMIVAAGHGLTYRNVQAIAEIESIEELNIGHNIVARAAFVGLERAVREMIAAIKGKMV